MSDYRSVLERDLDRIGPASFGLTDLARRRDRRRRQRRIAAGIVALVVSALAIGGWLGALAFDRGRITGDDRKTPQVELPTAPADWSRVRFPGSSVSSITEGGPGLVATGTDDSDAVAIWTSSDGVTWDHVEQEFTGGFFSDVTSGGPGLVAVGGWSGGAVWTSEDGLTWSRAPSPVLEGAWLQAVVPGGPGLVAVGEGDEGSQAWYTDDGREWSLASVPPPPDAARFDGEPEAWMDIAASAGRLVAVGQIATNLEGGAFGYETVVWTSDDGISWTDVPGTPLESNPGEMHVNAGPDGFVAIGSYGVWTSDDGERWQAAPEVGGLRFDQPTDHYYPRMSSVASGLAGYVAAGRDYQCELQPSEARNASCRPPQAVIWTSADGVTWSRVGPDPRFEAWDSARVGSSLVTAWGDRFLVAGAADLSVTLWISGPSR